MNIQLSNTIIEQFLTKLGFTNEEIEIYSTLTRHGDLSILELSRKSGVQRSKIYRLVEEMTEKNLIKEVTKTSGKRLHASDPEVLEKLVYEQEENTILLKKLLPDIQRGLSGITSQTQPGTEMIFYRGQAGIKQMIWNTLSAKSEILGYTYRKLAEITGENFSTKWYTEYQIRKLKFRELYSDNYLKSLNGAERPKNLYESRYISSDILDINHQSDIYDDVVTHYNWFEGEVFGVEIHNEKVAQMQRQIFEIVWKTANNPPIDSSD